VLLPARPNAVSTITRPIRDECLDSSPSLSAGSRERNDQAERSGGHKPKTCPTVPSKLEVAPDNTSQAEKTQTQAQPKSSAPGWTKANTRSRPSIPLDPEHSSDQRGRRDSIDGSARDTTVQCRRWDETLMTRPPCQCECSKKVYPNFSQLYHHRERVKLARERPTTCSQDSKCSITTPLAKSLVDSSNPEIPDEPPKQSRTAPNLPLRRLVKAVDEEDDLWEKDMVKFGLSLYSVWNSSATPSKCHPLNHTPRRLAVF
jgi:hypothetical protein